MDKEKQKVECSVLLARQPIYDADLNVVAYELLYRPNNGKSLEELGGDYATLRVLTHMIDIGHEHLTDNLPAFVNFTKKLLLNPPYDILDQEHVIIEILEDITIDKDLIAALKSMSDRGYKIALDDYRFTEETRPLLEIADIVKIDGLALNMSEIQEHVDLIKPYGPKLLLEKVETHELYEFCKGLGFDYFQGYFLSKPNLVNGCTIEGNKVVLMKIMGQLQDPDIDMKSLEQTLSQDPNLSTKLLKTMSSAAFQTKRKIESLHEAIVRVDLNYIRTLASIVIMSSIEDKPVDLIRQTITRAKMCELLAAGQNEMKSDQYFTVGLFSMLDAALDQELSALIEQIPLVDEVKKAILSHEGKMGSVLETVINYTQGDWDSMEIDEEKAAVCQKCYIEAVDWTRDMLSMLES